MTLSSIPEHFTKYINPKNPLGPLAADKIKHDDVAEKLFNRGNASYTNLLSKDIDVIIGRRGSGKTALLNTYKHLGALTDDDRSTLLTSDASNYDIVIFVSSHKLFEKMQSQVVGPNSIFRPIESIVDDWEKLLGDSIISEVCSKSEDNILMQPAISYLNGPDSEERNLALEYIWGKSIFKRKRAAELPPTQCEALDAVEKYLALKQKNLALIFDSLDEYMVGDRVVDRTIGALLRYVKNFNSNREKIRIKVALPSEIFPEIQRASANPLRDMVRFEHIHWTFNELTQIAAHRYSLFLEMYDSETHKKFSSFDLSRPRDIRKFWNSFLNSEIVTKHGHREAPLIHIARHTQLLPRQFLVILEQLIVRSQEQTGGYRELKPDLIPLAIEENERNVATEILNAYFYVYPSAEKIGQLLFTQFSNIFTFDELEAKWKRVGRPMEHSSTAAVSEFVDLVEMLLRIGIVGVPYNETDRYIETKFSYNSASPPNIGQTAKLCVHPIFSKHFNCTISNGSKAILPSGVPAT